MRAVALTTLFRAGAVLALASIMVLSFLPASLGASGSSQPGHVFAYAVLTGAGVIAIPGARSARGMLLLVIAVTSLGIAIEWLQPLVGRTTSRYDILANEAGILIGLMIRPILRSARHLVVGRARIRVSATAPLAAPGAPLARKA